MMARVSSHRLLTFGAFVLTNSNMHKNDRVREFLLPRLRKGTVSVSQAALVAGITRQAVSRWCSAAGFKPCEAEARYVLELQLTFRRWDKGMLKASRSKADLRSEADAAKRSWDHERDS